MVIRGLSYVVMSSVAQDKLTFRFLMSALWWVLATLTRLHLYTDLFFSSNCFLTGLKGCGLTGRRSARIAFKGYEGSPLAGSG